MLSYIKSNAQALIISLIVAGLYIALGFEIERHEFVSLFGVYTALFLLTYLLIRQFGYNFWLLAIGGIAFRLLFIPAFPGLSQDYFRFLWDGQLISSGISPYTFTPQMYMGGHELSAGVTILHDTELIKGMGELNASHYSNYPPVNQLFFGLAALLSGKSILGSVVVLRVFIILADIGILVLGKRLLERLNLPAQHIFLYFLNPFVIIEFTWNLHFEGVMLFFLLAAIFFLYQGKWMISAVLFALSVSTKLIPLIFLPLFYHYFVDKGLFSSGLWRLKKFFWLTIGIVGLTFLPFLSMPFLENFSNTISLWFRSFEFNASVFYIIRWVGFQVNGWDPIETVGKILPWIVVAFTLLMAFFRKNDNTKKLLTAMLFTIAFYFMLSTTVHPWYIATPLLLCVFTKYRFAYVWSFTVMLSYHAYTAAGFSEKMWIVALEYLLAGGFLAYELFGKKVKSIGAPA